MSLHHVLGVLEDREDRLWLAFSGAVRLAEAERARLTLVKTTDPGRIVRWFSPFVLGALYVPGGVDPQTAAAHALARAAEFVPQQVPVTTRLLGQDTQRALQRLVASGAYDALVATAALLSHYSKLTRDLRRLGVRAVAVTPEDIATSIEIGAST